MLSRLALRGAFFVFTSLLAAQTANTTLTGYVNDPSGAPVPNAKVTLTNSGTSVTVSTATNSTGFYSLPYVVPGNYNLTVEAPGFQRQSTSDFRVDVGLSKRTDFSLQVGQTQQSMTVTAGAEMLQTDNASIGTVVSPRQVNELPLNGRNPLSLVALAPGVVPQGQAQQNAAGTNNSAFGNYQIGGGTANQSQWLLDGATMVTPFGHAVELLPSQEVIREFNVQTNNLGAEYGGFTGGVVNLSTKSGTSQLHGSAYEFLRNKELNANNFFNNKNGVPTGAFTQNQFGQRSEVRLSCLVFITARTRHFSSSTMKGSGCGKAYQCCSPCRPLPCALAIFRVPESTYTIRSPPRRRATLTRASRRAAPAV
jgi:hypothetical protein